MTASPPIPTWLQQVSKAVAGGLATATGVTGALGLVAAPQGAIVAFWVYIVSFFVAFMFGFWVVFYAPRNALPPGELVVKADALVSLEMQADVPIGSTPAGPIEAKPLPLPARLGPGPDEY